MPLFLTARLPFSQGVLQTTLWLRMGQSMKLSSHQNLGTCLLPFLTCHCLSLSPSYRMAFQATCMPGLA